jgi:translation elongation factor P/translation initiation factor 5A
MKTIITEHFGKADTSVEVVELSNGNITVIHKDGEAIIFSSIYEMTIYSTNPHTSCERFYCKEEQLEFVYENFTDYQDIVDNFDVKNTKRK